MTIREANKRLLFQLYHHYGKSEAESITNIVMERLTGWKRVDQILNNNAKISFEMESLLGRYIDELNTGKPLQYVLNEAWFCGMKLYVNENVLIPRPETEELVEWIVTDNIGANISVLDIGTGSGCIAIALKKKLPLAKVYACDISTGALKIAARNASRNGTDVVFFQTDILLREQRSLLPAVDVVVSNPPYIPFSEKTTMDKNVVDYEPHVALFVDDNDPLIFYKAIAGMPARTVYLEVHEDYAGNVARLLDRAEIKKDMQGKQRMVKGKPY